MNLLDLIPGINQILDKVITSPKEKAELETRLRELDIRELEAKAQVQASWLGNKSLFVSGAIPSILWMMVLVIFFNFILSPIIQTFGYTIPVLDLPQWYAELCSTIVLGLFAKKAWDSTDMAVGKFNKKSKYESESQTTYNMMNSASSLTTTSNDNNIKEFEDVEEDVIPELKESAAPVKTDNVQIIKEKPNYDDPEYINMRLKQMEEELNRKNR